MDDETDGDVTSMAAVPPTLKLSATDRLQRFREDDEALAELARKAHERAMSDDEGANASGHLDLKCRERRAAMWGYDSPVRFDLVAVSERSRPSSYDQIKAAVLGFIDRLPPEQQALRRRLAELSPTQALELLGLPKPIDGNGAADGGP